MVTNKKPYLEKVKGDTYCLVTGYSRIPVFKLGGGRAVMMDSGLAVPDRSGILDTLAAEGLRVTAVLTSHAHIDHTGNHRALQEAYGAKLYMTGFDAAVSGNPVNLKAYFYGSSYRGVMGYAESMFCRADRHIAPEDRWVEVEGAKFEILRLPGHAPEHLGFVTPDGVAYLADTLMSEPVLRSVKIPYSMCCELDIQTKKRVREMAYDCYIVAHNGVYSDVSGLADLNIKSLMEKIDVVERLADHYMSLERIVAQAGAAMGIHGDTVYKINVAERNIRVFVEHLLDMKRLVQRADNGVIEYIRADCL